MAAEPIPPAAPCTHDHAQPPCPICGLPRCQQPKTKFTTLAIKQTPAGPVAHYGEADLSDDRWTPTEQGRVWYADWKRAHPEEAAAVEAWAEAAVDRAIARERARKATQAMPEPPESPDAA
jgi:hypothetical protein